MRKLTRLSFIWARIACLIAALLYGIVGSGMPVYAMASISDTDDAATQEKKKTKDAFRGENRIVFSDDSCSTEEADANKNTLMSSNPNVGNGGGCGSKDPEANKRQVWNFLKDKGLNDAAAAGIMGNMQKESSFNPKAVNGIGCRGVVQWCFGRNDDMESWINANYPGEKRWDCLGGQLEYMWYEMTKTEQGRYTAEGDYLEIPLPDALNGGEFSRKNQYNGSASANAASIFHDYFERANKNTGEHLGRGEAAEQVYKEMTGGEDTSILAATENKNTEEDAEECPDEEGKQDEGSSAIPSEDCKELIEKFWQLEKQGKIKLVDKSRQENDFKNCTTEQIECGTGGGKGGVNPKVLRAVVGAAENTGDGAVEIWSFNTGHDCDGLNHPHGKAVDIVCKGNDLGYRTATEKCNNIFKYLYDNYEELGTEELIWQYPPGKDEGAGGGYSCSDPKIMCNVAGHDDHIHFGVE